MMIPAIQFVKNYLSLPFKGLPQACSSAYLEISEFLLDVPLHLIKRLIRLTLLFLVVTFSWIPNSFGEPAVTGIGLGTTYGGTYGILVAGPLGNLEGQIVGFGLGRVEYPTKVEGEDSSGEFGLSGMWGKYFEGLPKSYYGVSVGPVASYAENKCTRSSSRYKCKGKGGVLYGLNLIVGGSIWEDLKGFYSDLGVTIWSQSVEFEIFGKKYKRDAVGRLVFSIGWNLEN